MQEIKNISAYKQALYDKIVTTAMHAFAQKGIRRVKMDDIAAQLSISKRTLYELFENKEVLLFEGVKKYHEQINNRLRVISEESENVMDVMLKVYRMKVDEFRSTSPQFYSDIVKYPEVMDYLKKKSKESHSRHLLFLKRGVEEGFFRNDVNLELVGKMFEAQGLYIMQQKLYTQFNIEDIFDILVFVSLRGLCTPKGILVLEKFH